MGFAGKEIREVEFVPDNRPLFAPSPTPERTEEPAPFNPSSSSARKRKRTSSSLIVFIMSQNESSPHHLERVADFAIGYRAWQIIKTPQGHPQLSAAFSRIVWSEEPKPAKCHRSNLTGIHTSPVAGCTCGYYAYHNLSDLLIMGESNYIYGAILGWGKVQVHSEGIRTQYAAPLAFLLPTKTIIKGGQYQLTAIEDEDCKILSKQYNVPLLSEKDLISYAQGFGKNYTLEEIREMMPQKERQQMDKQSRSDEVNKLAEWISYNTAAREKARLQDSLTTVIATPNKTKISTTPLRLYYRIMISAFFIGIVLFGILAIHLLTKIPYGSR